MVKITVQVYTPVGLCIVNPELPRVSAHPAQTTYTYKRPIVWMPFDVPGAIDYSVKGDVR